MLLKHSLFYTLARGVPGLVNFLAIAIYTRWLAPGEYGYYALVLAAVGLLDSVLFQWLRLGLLRFLPAQGNRPHELLATLFIAFLGTVAFTSLLGLVALLVWSEQLDYRLLVAGVVLLWVQGWYELNLELARSRLEPLRYGWMSIFKSLLALMIGFMLVLLGLGALAPLLGLLAGMMAASLLLAWREWRGLQGVAADPDLLLQLLRYGLPMTATYALSFLVSSSDRFILGWFMGAEAPGLYAPGYDLAQFSLIMIMTIVNLAAYPMVVRALDNGGLAAARRHLERVLVLMVITALPVAVGMMVCAGNIATVLLGETYRESAAGLIPLIAVSSFVFGVKIFYLDLAFQLSKKTYLEPRVMAWAALINVLLNLWWIPLYGLAGAAGATVVAYCLGALLSWYLGRRVFSLPPPSRDVGKISVACMAMVPALWLVADFRGGLALIGQIVAGLLVYVAALIVLDAAGIRRRIIARLTLRPVPGEKRSG